MIQNFNNGFKLMTYDSRFKCFLSDIDEMKDIF